MPDQQTYLSPDLAPRLAAIDIGSNSLRLVVAEAQPAGRYRILDDERESTRLGRALASSDRLDEQAIEASLAALRRFKSIAEGLGVVNLRAIATCAVREATNGSEFCQRVEEQLDLPVEVISAEKEARLAFHSVRRRFDLLGKNTLLADIGGGSTEIIRASGELIEAIYTTNLGAVRLGARFGGGQSLAGHDYDRMLKAIDRQLKKSTEKPVAPVHLLIGSGGTFTTLANVLMSAKGQADLPVAGCQVTRAELRHLVDRLRKMSLKQRREVPGLNPDRADIIVPGLAVIDRIMRRFKINLLQVHPYGVRDGLLLSMFERLQLGNETASADTAAAIERFSAACGVEIDHASHVAKLACEILDGLTADYQVSPDDRRLLDASARLQDVGYLISYEAHHKHSYHLILNSRLEGFRPEEIQIIANVSRYHRGAEPKKKHANFQALSPEDQHRVKSLAGILRLAGGLDRSHNQNIRSVRVNGTAKQIELIVNAEEYPEVNIWAARRRAGLFEKTFEAEVNIRWEGAQIEKPETAPSTLMP